MSDHDMPDHGYARRPLDDVQARRRSCSPDVCPVRPVRGVYAMTLDEAWAEVEAALPEGVELFLTKDVLNEPEQRYEVEAAARTLTEGRTGADWTFSADFKAQYASGPTPAAALNALAIELRDAAERMGRAIG